MDKSFADSVLETMKKLISREQLTDKDLIDVSIILMKRQLEDRKTKEIEGFSVFHCPNCSGEFKVTTYNISEAPFTCPYCQNDEVG